MYVLSNTIKNKKITLVSGENNKYDANSSINLIISGRVKPNN